MVVGSKAKVWHGNADKTSGGLTKENLMKNKHGRIVSIKKHERGKEVVKNLVNGIAVDSLKKEILIGIAFS